MPKSRRSPTGKRQIRSPITAPFQVLIEAARRKQASKHHKKLALHHWVVALRDMFPILPRDLEWDDMKVFEIKSRLRNGDAGPPLSVQSALRSAARIARTSGSPVATIDELALAILDAACLVPAGECPPYAPAEPVPPTPSSAQAAQPGPGNRPPTPMLERFGRNLSREAAAGLLSPVIDRQQQIALMIETLCRRTKRNIALIGQPGVGKRAIVEGLAQRIASRSVPAALANVSIVEVQLTALLAGVSSLAELDERFVQLLAEARFPGTVLFFDELRTVTPAGHDALTLAISNQLKPELARGGVTCIVSGAEEDYMRFVELDASLRAWFAQWFQPIRVDELTAEATLEALDLVAAHTAAMTGVVVAPAVLKWIVAFAGELLKSHRFPGKAVDLFEQCVAHSLSKGSQKVTLADAREVAERAIAIPSDMESRLRRISKLLAESGLLAPEDERAIVDRLSVTMRSLDLVPARPNAMVLLVGTASAAGRALAEALADGIGGSTDRVIAIDFGLLTEPWDTRQLLGVPGPNAPATTDLPLHRLVEEPWSVILAENVDACHPQVRSSVSRALSEGYFIDAKGKKIYMSDAIVVLTAPSVEGARVASMGFGPQDAQDVADARTIVAKIFDPDLVNQMDLVVPRLNREADLVGLTRQQSLLADLTKRYRTRGLDITWDKSVVEWFRAEPQQRRSQREWEQWADRSLASALIPHLPARPPSHRKRVLVKREGEQLIVGDVRAASKAR